VTVKYDINGPDILKDINLTFQAGERVAIVGRTGSGKSTLVLSLLRFTHIASGTILYDGVDIERVPRKHLRKALTVVPQEAVLFNGTVGSNLDPTGDVPPRVLQDALDACADIASFQFRDRPAEANGSAPAGRPSERDDAGPASSSSSSSETQPLLASADNAAGYAAVAATATVTATAVADAARGLSLTDPVMARGENFSHGQRQVLSLCRALVRRSPLMLLDEATASMDYETDRGVQGVLRRELATTAVGSQRRRRRTLVTVAHRLRTIADYDKVVVLGAGRVLEVGSPAELMRRDGVFAEMLRHSGEAGELQGLIAGEASTNGDLGGSAREL